VGGGAVAAGAALPPRTVPGSALRSAAVGRSVELAAAELTA